MKLIAKLVLVAAIGGAGATMYAAPGMGGGTNDDTFARGVLVQGRMKTDFQTIAQLQAKAKANRDVIKLSCVNDKFVVAKPLMNISDRLLSEISSASDHASADTSLGSLTNNGEQMRELREAASQCIDSKVIANESSNSFTHPVIPGVTGTTPPNYGIEPPAYASPDK